MHSWPLTSTACWSPTCNVPFGYLAVDLFFALSGFVIAHAYDPRFERGMTAPGFLRRRVERLFPLFWLACLVGVVPFVSDVYHHRLPLGAFVTMTSTNLLMLPSPTWRQFPTPFPLVAPAWSLFLELWIANLGYAVLWRWLRGRVLVLVVALSGCWLAVVTVRNGTLDVGAVWPSFLDGFARVLFSFFLGVLLHRWNDRVRMVRVPAILVLAAVGVSFWPRLPAGLGAAYELACVALVYPFCILMGASARERRPILGEALGNMSYALYLIHIPLLMIALRLNHLLKLTPGKEIAALFTAGCVVVALVIDAFYDRRARRVLGRLLATRGMRHRLAG